METVPGRENKPGDQIVSARIWFWQWIHGKSRTFESLWINLWGGDKTCISRIVQNL